MEFFARVEAKPDFEPTWVLWGLGSRPRVLRVVEDSDQSDLDDEGVAAGHRMYRVFHTGPVGATGVVAGEGFLFAGSEDGVPWE